MGACSSYRPCGLNTKGMLYEVKLPLSCMNCGFSIVCFYTLCMYWLEYNMLIKNAQFCYQIKLLNTYDNKIPCLQGVKLLKYIYDREIVKIQYIYMGYIMVELLSSKPLSCTKCDSMKFCDYKSVIFLIQSTVLEMIESVDYVMLGEIVLWMHVWTQLNMVCSTYVMLYEYTAQTKLMARHHWVLTRVSGMPFSCMECGTSIDFNFKESCHEVFILNIVIAHTYVNNRTKWDKWSSAIIHSNG